MTASLALDWNQARAACRAIAVITSRDLLRQLKHPGMLLTQAMQIGFIVVVFSVGFDAMVQPSGGVPFSAYAFPGIIAIQAVTVGINAGLGYAWDREFGVLREMLVAPVPKMCLPAGKVVATATVVCAQTAVMLLAAPLLKVPLHPAGFVLGVAAYTFTGAVFATLGLFLATSVKRIQTLQAGISLAMFPMLFLSGSVFRPEDVPGWLAGAVIVNPMSYAVDLVRHLLLADAGYTGLAPAGVDVLVLAALGMLAAAGIRWRVGR